MSKVELFDSLNAVEAWAKAHGVVRLREVVPNLSEASAFLAVSWLKRFDACVTIAREQNLVHPRTGGDAPNGGVLAGVGARVIQGPWLSRR
ncbi:MAG TPA: hypothetical protein VM491_16735 [Burkholderiaceae bacterium]|nr:hypothetical protein [Burkholderiaceae bacterium]